MSRTACGGSITPAVGAIAAILFSAGPAAAHGGFFWPREILIAPDAPERWVVRSDARGFLVTFDGGQSVRWLCTEAFNVDSIRSEHREVALVGEGQLYVAGLFEGLWISTADACGWRTVSFFDDPARCDGEICIVRDVTTSRGDVFVLTSFGVQAPKNRLFRSNDGDAFEEAFTLPDAMIASSVAFAPSDPSVVYVAADEARQFGAQLIVTTEDGGGSFRSVELAVTNPAAPVRIHAVHPLRPEVVVVHEDSDQASEPYASDFWYLSTDAGRTFRTIFQGADLPGFAISPDGDRVAVAGPMSGIWTARLDALEQQGQGAFRQVSERAAYGLTWTDRGLFVGLDPYTDGSGAIVGITDDGSGTAETVVSICGLGIVSCPSGTPAGDECGSPFYGPGGIVADITSKVCTARGDAGHAPGDAGGAPAKRSVSGGLCAVAGLGRSEFAYGLVTLLGALALRRATRRVR